MRAPLIISLLLLFFSSYICADITIRYDSIGPQHQKPISTVLMKNNLVRVNNMSSKQPDVMIDLNSGNIIQLHRASKSYFKINTKTINQYVSLYRQNKGFVQALINQGTKSLDPQKRSKIQQMMDQYDQKSTSAGINFQDTGKSDRVIGIQCQIFTLLEQGLRKTDVCLASYQQLELPLAEVQSFEKLKKMAQQFKQSSPDQKDLLSIMANGLEGLNGVPMKVINYYPNGKIKTMIQAGSISLKQVPKNNFRIPHDFQQKLSPIL